MADVKWIKITVDMFDNRKIRHLRKLPEGNSICLIWVMLLTMAGRCNAGGMVFLTENIPYSPKMLADELDFEESTVCLALEAFERLGMVSTSSEGFLHVTGWEEHQNAAGLDKIREQNRQRQARFKAGKRAIEGKAKAATQGNVTGNVMVTQGNATEREEDIDKDKDILSLASAGEKRRAITGELGNGLVVISDSEMDDLLDMLSPEELERYIGVVARCEAAGLHYGKPHYRAILEMAEQDRRS